MKTILGVDMQILLGDFRRAKLVKIDKSPGIFYIFFKLLFSHKSRILLLLRFATGREYSILAKIVQYLLSHMYLIEIGTNIKIGNGLLLPHPRNIIIGGSTILGEDVTIAQNVTIGGNFKKSKIINGERRKMPIIGNRVWIASGSVVAGPVIIGDDVVIGANSVVTKDVPSNSLVYGQNCISKKKIVLEQGSYRVLVSVST